MHSIRRLRLRTGFTVCSLAKTAVAPRPLPALCLASQAGPSVARCTFTRHYTSPPLAQTMATNGSVAPIAGNFEYIFLDNEWVPGSSSDRIPVICPSDGTEWGKIARGNKEDIDRAVKSARHAFDEGAWGKLTALDRNRLLTKWRELVLIHADELAMLEAKDTGKPLKQAKADITALARYMEFYGSAADKHHGTTIPFSLPGYSVMTFKEPHGVCAVMVPWNYPCRWFLIGLRRFHRVADRHRTLIPSCFPSVSFYMLANSVRIALRNLWTFCLGRSRCRKCHCRQARRGRLPILAPSLHFGQGSRIPSRCNQHGPRLRSRSRPSPRRTPRHRSRFLHRFSSDRYRGRPGVRQVQQAEHHGTRRQVSPDHFRGCGLGRLVIRQQD